MPLILIDLNKRIFFRIAEIVGQGPWHFTAGYFSLMLRFQFPQPHILFFVFDRDSGRECPDFLLLYFRPELDQGHGTIKADIQSAVKKIVKTFQQGEYGIVAADSFFIFCAVAVWREVSIHPVHGPSPDCSAVGQNVHFIEQHSAIPQRLRAIVYIFRLPLVDLAAPCLVFAEAGCRDVPRMRAACAKKIGITSQPFPA